MIHIQVAALRILTFNVVLLVASMPIALRVVCVSTLAFGCKELAKHGAIVSRIDAIEELAGCSILCSDKTGTLTLNKMQMQPDVTVYDGDTECTVSLESDHGQNVLCMAAMAVRWWEPARDAIDTLVLQEQSRPNIQTILNNHEHLDFLPFDPSTKRTASVLRNKTTGETFSVCKGAPNLLLDMSCESTTVKDQYKMTVQNFAQAGTRCLAVIRNSSYVDLENDSPGQWTIVGLLTFLDPPRPDSKATIEIAHDMGVDVKMITGDHIAIAREVTRTLGLAKSGTGSPLRSSCYNNPVAKYVPGSPSKSDPIVIQASSLPEIDLQALQTATDLGDKYGEDIENVDSFAGAVPAQKYLIVQALRQRGHIVAMTGDGVNDAPALKRADIGIAVMGATDAARGAADLVLTKTGLSTIAVAIMSARRVCARMQNFVIYRIACTIQLLFFFLVACLFFHPDEYNQDWPPYFSLPVVSLITVTILNDGTIVSVAFDHVQVNRRPEE